MIKQVSTISMLSVFFLVGCMNSTINSSALVKSQKAYESIKKDALLNEYAAPSLFQAGKLYNLSKTAKTNEEANHFAYLLKQEIEVTKESAKGKRLEAQIDALRDKKTKVLLSSKEDEILKAKEAQRRVLEESKRIQEESDALAQKYQELQELNAKMTNRGLVLTLGDVLFETARANLMSGATRGMDKLAAFLMDNEARKVLIEGHTDNVGSITYNIDLSLRRAEAVEEALVYRGIAKERIVTKGYGETYPVVENSSAISKQQNRRVEIVILNEGENVEDITR